MLAPLDELKEKFKYYGLTTLGAKRVPGRDRSRSPLRYDGNTIPQGAPPPGGDSATKNSFFCCDFLFVCFLFGSGFQSQVCCDFCLAVLLQLRR